MKTSLLIGVNFFLLMNIGRGNLAIYQWFQFFSILGDIAACTDWACRVLKLLRHCASRDNHILPIDRPSVWQFFSWLKVIIARYFADLITSISIWSKTISPIFKPKQMVHKKPILVLAVWTDLSGCSSKYLVTICWRQASSLLIGVFFRSIFLRKLAPI